MNQLLNVEIKPLNSSEVIKSKAINISNSGIKLETNKLIEPPGQADIKIFFKENQKHYQTKARIIWAKEVLNNSHHYGVQFINLEQNKINN